MPDREEEDLQMALRMSLQGSQGSPPEAKRSKPREVEESPEARNRRVQRELMAAAAERRILATGNKVLNPSSGSKALEQEARKISSPVTQPVERRENAEVQERKSEAGEHSNLLNSGEELPPDFVEQLFLMLFGVGVSKDILAQWSNQGITFSPDPETCIGLVQHEGGPCGVLATIQAFALKYLLFFPQELDNLSPVSLKNSGGKTSYQGSSNATGNFLSVTEERKISALVLGMVEILFLCGSKKRAIVATLNIPGLEQGLADHTKIEATSKALESIRIESASDLHKVLRVNTFTTQASAFQHLIAKLPELQSRMGAMLFLISALLSRGLESIQADRDDPSQPLVTAPFGHASQEIVNLLLCGFGVPNVFDGHMDLGGGMSLKGIPGDVEIGFLTLLESLNFCKVGQHLKRPRWPIWVVGSESHYTVLFAPDASVQNENELEEQESRIRRAFDSQDQSGGGGFVSVEGFQQVVRETGIGLSHDKMENLCSMGFIVWSELWKVLLELDRSLGGLKDSTGSMGSKEFDIYHFNGMAKSVLNGQNSGEGGSPPVQRPKLCKLHVSVPPKWTQEEFLSDILPSPPPPPGGVDSVVGSGSGSETASSSELPPQHSPLVDCIRTRWPRAVCRWDGDAPSIV